VYRNTTCWSLDYLSECTIVFYDFVYVDKLSCKILQNYKNTLLLFRTVAYCSQASLVAAMVRLLFCIAFTSLWLRWSMMEFGTPKCMVHLVAWFVFVLTSFVCLWSCSWKLANVNFSATGQHGYSICLCFMLSSMALHLVVSVQGLALIILSSALPRC
jgi:hypothetical protein